MVKEGGYHIETINGHTFRLRYLPGGMFYMGSRETGESPIHKVELSPFFIGEYPVTQVLWKALMGVDSNPSRFIGDLRPVEQVSWVDIVEGNQRDNGKSAFLQKLNEHTESTRPLEYKYRLPTEAEWEYAAQGGESFKYAGDGQLKKAGWYSVNAHEETKVVGLKRPNGFQLYDMCGNVREWCVDKYSGSFYQECHDQMSVIDPINDKEESQSYIIRGGSWRDNLNLCSIFFRSYWRPTYRDFNVGFRLVLGAEQQRNQPGQKRKENSVRRIVKRSKWKINRYIIKRR